MAKCETEDDSETNDDESFQSEGDSLDDRISYRGEVQAEEDLDQMSEFAETDADDEDDEDFVEGDVTWEDWYNEPERLKTNVRQHFLACFLRYLRHAEGGLISDEQSLLHVRQVHKVLDTLQKDGEDLNCLLTNQRMNVWDGFCVPHLRNKVLTGNTIKTYLRSVEMFARFVEKGLFYDAKLLNDLQKASIISLQSRMADYRRSVHRRTAGQTTTRDVDEAYHAMTADDLRTLEQSELAKRAITLIGNALEHHVLTKKEFTVVRDFLMVTMQWENASRPAPLENAKVSRFNRATYTASEQRWTMLVDEHKTTRHQGPAELVMDNRLYGYIKNYVDHIRPVFVSDPQEEAVFVQQDGKQFVKGTIGKRITEFYKKAGVRSDIRVSSTKVRKLFSGEAFNLPAEKKRLVNRHMKHKETTADSNYVLKINAKRSAKAHSIMHEIVHGQKNKGEGKKECEGSEDARDNETTSDSEQTNNYSDESDQIVEGSKEPREEKEDEEPCVDPSINLTNDDKVVIKSVFKNDIETGRQLSMQELRVKMRSVRYLRIMLVNERKVKKVADFVRNQTKRAVIASQIEEDPYLLGVKSNPSSLSRKQWSDDDVSSIEERFQKFKEMPSKKIVIKIFDDQETKYVLCSIKLHHKPTAFG